MAAKKKAPARRRAAKRPATASTFTGPVVVKDGPLPLDDAMQIRDLEYTLNRVRDERDESQRILADTRAALKALALIFGRQRGSGY